MIKNNVTKISETEKPNTYEGNKEVEAARIVLKENIGKLETLQEGLLKLSLDLGLTSSIAQAISLTVDPENTLNEYWGERNLYREQVRKLEMEILELKRGEYQRHETFHALIKPVRELSALADILDERYGCYDTTDGWVIYQTTEKIKDLKKRYFNNSEEVLEDDKEGRA